jgi:ABC-type uncharacterized transport system ATPase subunit
MAQDGRSPNLIAAEGTVAEISKDPQVKAIYLGEDA